MVGLIVAQGGDLLPYADGFAAVGTDGLAGVTGAGAGGSQCSLRLGVGVLAGRGLTGVRIQLPEGQRLAGSVSGSIIVSTPVGIVDVYTEVTVRALVLQITTGRIEDPGLVGICTNTGAIVLICRVQPFAGSTRHIDDQLAIGIGNVPGQGFHIITGHHIAIDGDHNCGRCAAGAIGIVQRPCGAALGHCNCNDIRIGDIRQINLGPAIGRQAGLSLATTGASAIDIVMAQGRNFSLGIQNLTAVGTFATLGQAGLGASSRNSRQDLGAGVLATGVPGAGILGVNGDTIHTNLAGAEDGGIGVRRCRENDRDNLAADSGSAGGDCALKRSSIIRSITGNLNFGHTGVSNGQRRALVEASGISIIAHIAGRRSLLVGNRDAILFPNLLGRGVAGAVGLVSKTDGCVIASRRRLTAAGAGAVFVAVAGGRNLIADVATIAEGTGIGGIAVLGAGRRGDGRHVVVLADTLARAAAQSIELGNIIGGLQLRALQNAHGHVVTIGTHIAGFRAHSGVQCRLFRIPSEDRVGRSGEGKVQVFSTGYKANVLLSAVFIHKVQIITASRFLQIHIHAIVVGGIGLAVVAAHLASKVEIAILCQRMQTQLIGSVGRGLRYNYGHQHFICLAGGALAIYIVVAGGGDLVTFVALAAEGAGIDGISLFRAGRSNGGAGHIVMIAGVGVLGLAGGRGHIGRDLRAEEQESKLRIVHEHITGAGDGLNRVVTAHFPGVDRVFLHPVKQHIQALKNARSAENIVRVIFGACVCTSPANIDIENDTGHITTEVISTTGDAVGIVVACAGILAIGLVATGAVLAGGGGTKHHNVIFTVSGSITLTVGPGVLPVPSTAAIPSRANGIAGIERGHFLCVLTAILAVRVLIKIFGILIAGLIAMIVNHQTLQRSIQGAAGRIGSAGAASLLGQGIIGCGSIERFRIGRQRGGCFATGTPVVDVFAGRVVDILKVGSIRHDLGRGQQADAQHQRQQQGQTTFDVYVHKCSLLICLMDFPFVQMHITSQYNYNIFTGGTQWYFPKKTPSDQRRVQYFIPDPGRCRRKCGAHPP